MDPPETRYTKSGDVHIAYQVTGSGPIDLVWVPGFVSNLELERENPEQQRFVARIGLFCRLIRFDKRGTGLSDRGFGIASLEERIDDVRAVMDAVDSRRAALLGQSEGGPMSILFAATYPERTQALILYASFAVNLTHGWSAEQLQARMDWYAQNWGTGMSATWAAPGKAADTAFVQARARWERLSASPAAVMALVRMNHEIDVRDILPTIRVPILVLHRSGDRRVSLDGSRDLAARMPGATYVELPGDQHPPFMGDAGRVADEIEEFLTGSRSSQAEPDRVLATVLFTDIVDSTKRAAEIGDRKWRALLDRHDQAVREQLARFRGREVKNLGDGFLATFDGPARAIRCAAAISHSVQPLGIGVRSGLHTGEIELKRDDIGGIAVHIAARVADLAQPGESLVSSTVRDLVAGSGLRFADRGRHALRGLPEEVHLYTALPEA